MINIKSCAIIAFMLKIRLQRIGRKNDPAFRVVLTDSKNSAKSGKFKEILGSYDVKSGIVKFNSERIIYWMKNGAQASSTVHNYLVTQGVTVGKKKNVLPKKSPTKTRKELKK